MHVAFNGLCVSIYGICATQLLLGVKIKKVAKNKLICLGLFCIFALMVNVLGFTSLSIQQYSNYYPFFIQLPVFIAFALVSPYSGIKLFFILLTSIISAGPSIDLSFFVSSFFEYNANIMSATRILGFITTYFLLRKFFCEPFHYMLKNCHKGWGTLSAMPLLYYFVSYILEGYYFTTQGWEEFGIFKVIMFLMVFSTYMITLSLFKQTRSQLMLAHEQEVFKLQLTEMETSITQLKKYRMQESVNRHDLRHHMQYISTCLTNKDVEEAQSYIAQVCDNINGVSVTEYCENDALNLILSSLVAKAQSQNIESSVNVSVSNEINIPSTDLCIIFANSIENAINACKKIPQSMPRKIKIDCHTKSGKVFLSIANTFQGYVNFDDDGLPKCNRTGHGLGTKSIAAMITKNNGLYEFKANHGTFTLNAIV